eukprot:3646989-Prymnesium_polylepis.1
MLELYSCSHTPPRLSRTRTSTPKVHGARQLQRWPLERAKTPPSATLLGDGLSMVQHVLTAAVGKRYSGSA